MTVRERLTLVAFNNMMQVEQPDGSVEITLTKRGESTRYRLVVKNLYQPDEKVLSDEVIKE